ncbi:MAG: histidine kinase [Bacteroidetes bacterium]|nr:histidine kinase [Bacteroidota bacterium]
MKTKPFYILNFAVTKLNMRFIITLILFQLLTVIVAQTAPPKENAIVKESVQLDNAYKTNDEYAIAKSYEQLGNEYLKNGNYLKAEEFYAKAKLIYEKLKKKQDKSRVSRLLAKSQEAQNKISQAIQNYEDAGSDDFGIAETPSSNSNESNIEDIEKPTTDKKDINGKLKQETAFGYFNQINLNDVNRLKNNSNLDKNVDLLENNIKLLEDEKAKNPSIQTELGETYQQLGNIQMQQNNIPQAIESYNNAYNTSITASGASSIGNQLTNVYISTGQFDEAIKVQKKILERKDIQQNTDLKIKQIQNLADVYLKNDDDEKALLLLQESYDLAIKNHKTKASKDCIEAMAVIYQKRGNTQKIISLYKQYLSNLEDLINNDVEIVDSKLIAITEEKIAQLEAEKKLKDQLIRKKNTFNYVLIFASTILLGLLLFIIKTLNSIKIKNKKIELQSLRREMNPHFVFNSLNSINNYIAQNDELAANKYLSAYSNLMRSTMENSNKDFISLSTELELLKRYLDLEQLRFSDKFSYTISVDENIDCDTIEIPNMLIQPQVENAIWHGLRYKETKGLLQLDFVLHNKQLLVKIQDDGIGFTKSQLLKTKNQQSHNSIGIKNTQNRITLLNNLYSKNISYKTTELLPPNEGTVVKISFDI